MLLLGSVLTTTAWALPTIYPTDVTLISTIKNTTNSNLVADNADPHTFWVMPPNSAYSKVGNLHSLTANIGFCREMQDLQTYSRRTLAHLAELEKEVAANEETFKQIDLKIQNARADLAEHAAINHLDELIKIDGKIAELDVQIQDLITKQHNCSSNCRELREQTRVARNERMEEVKLRRQLYLQHSTSARAYESKRVALQGLLQELADAQVAVNRPKDTLTAIRSSFHKMYESFTTMEGGRASISFESGWDNNIEKLRQENPGFSFNKISTQNTVITTSIADIPTLPVGGAILNYYIGGSVTSDKISLPSYPDNFSGNLRLSLLGACPALHPEYFDINVPNGTNEMKYGLIASYEYPSAFKVSAKATYNMHKMYSKIASSGKKGGFFRTKSWSKTEERTFFQDSFKVTWSEQDAANSISNEEKDELESQWRMSILSRLAVIGLPAVVNAGQLTIPQPGKSGALVLGEELAKNKFCSSNAYCTAAAVGLNVLDAIFGSSSSSASYTNVQDANLVEEWSREKVVYKPMVTSYR